MISVLISVTSPVTWFYTANLLNDNRATVKWAGHDAHQPHLIALSAQFPAHPPLPFKSQYIWGIQDLNELSKWAKLSSARALGLESGNRDYNYHEFEF